MMVTPFSCRNVTAMSSEAEQKRVTEDHGARFVYLDSGRWGRGVAGSGRAGCPCGR
jgi:hypothetical protein